ncbi:unnamed protein product [Paramecium pentaurelia]|uniref:Uncharacterized protein n=1 Tax=Paramecium pentaurelia TaxID=43138 RepID=A0A8S1V8U0_9CILI|nr:unnamed protein product [Paramecium pentaurelia]
MSTLQITTHKLPFRICMYTMKGSNSSIRIVVSSHKFYFRIIMQLMLIKLLYLWSKLKCYDFVDHATKCISFSKDKCICNDGYFVDHLLLSCQPCIRIHLMLRQLQSLYQLCNKVYGETSIPNQCLCLNNTYEVYVTKYSYKLNLITQLITNHLLYSKQFLSCIDINQSVLASNQYSPCLQCQGNASHCAECKDLLNQIYNEEFLCPSGYLKDNYNCIL